jgi:hypothetical protein
VRKNKIIKIVPYFGKLPKFWTFYLHSLEKQSEYIDLLFVTDIDLSKETLPQNVKIINYSLEEYFKLIEGKFDLNISYRKAYKSCDFKPMLGYIFSEEIKSYSHWAFGDIDIIFGHLHRYLKKPLEDGYDVITFREDWVSGAFTVIKNTQQNNELFKDSPDYKEVLLSNRSFAFDECCSKYSYLREGYTTEEVYNMKLKNDIVCFSTVVSRAAQSCKIRLYMRYYVKESLPFNEILEYKHGKIIGGGSQEFALYHFVYQKKFKKNIVLVWKNIPDYYLITTTGLYTKAQFKYGYALIKLLRTVYGFLVEKADWIKDAIKYRLKL